jgi:hypothetical protein
MKVRMLYGWSALSLRQMLPLLEEPTTNEGFDAMHADLIMHLVG